MSGLSLSVRKRLPGFDLDVGWAVDDGFTVLFGYSGAGKSLTLSMIAGTLRPDAGRVVLGGRTLVDSETSVWVSPQNRRIGYVPQSAQLFPHMTVRGNVEYALRPAARRKRRARATILLEQLRIADLAEKKPHELSGGQRQRAAIARVLAIEPAAVLLDEPLSALDLPLRVEMRDVLREVHQETRVPFVMVTHDLVEAVSLADTLVVYSGNGVVQTGAPHELLGDPGTPEIRRLLHAMELPQGLLGTDNAGRLVPLTRKDEVA